MKINHIGFIMDGNRRFAKKNGFMLERGYSKGMNNFLEVVKCQVKYGIPMLSFFALSNDNFDKRDKGDLEPLFKLVKKFSEDDKIFSYFRENKIKVLLKGDIEGIKAKIEDNTIELLEKRLEEINEVSGENCEFVVNIALNYGGQMEIVRAIKRVCSKVESGEAQIEDINEDLIKENLWFDGTVPEIIVRTGDAPRLSGFMLWDSQYSEIYLTKKLWPELEEEDFVEIMEWYSRIKRNFGK